MEAVNLTARTLNLFTLKPGFGTGWRTPFYHPLPILGIAALRIRAWLFLGWLACGAGAAEMPQLQKNHGAWQFMVDGNPFLMRGGEFANNKDVDAVSPFCEAAWQAGRRAFVKLMERIKDQDAGRYTVIVVQPENETGCQEFDEIRDHCPAADKAWASPVPEDFMKYLAAHDGRLVEWFQKVWARAGKKTSGTRLEVFDAGTDGQKIFMSYYIGRFIEQVASTGKAIHPLLMFVNDWLGDLDAPGGPLGGPVFHVMDSFCVTTTSAVACLPDIYQEHFKAWVTAFDQQENPSLIPEARSDARAAQQCWYTFLEHDGLLFSPWLLVPRESDQKSVPPVSHLLQSQNEL